MRTPRRSPSERKWSLSAATVSRARVMSAMMTIANLACTTVWLMSMMLHPASARGLSARRPDLCSVMAGATTCLLGLSVLVLPDQLVARLPSFAYAYLPWFSTLLMALGLALLAVQLLAPPIGIVRVVHLVCTACGVVWAVVADRLGAGIGEVVMCAYGKAARTAIGNQDMSIEAAVVGIIDRVDVQEQDARSDELVETSRELRGGDDGR